MKTMGKLASKCVLLVVVAAIVLIFTPLVKEWSLTRDIQNDLSSRFRTETTAMTKTATGADMAATFNSTTSTSQDANANVTHKIENNTKSEAATSTIHTIKNTNRVDAITATELGDDTTETATSNWTKGMIEANSQFASKIKASVVVTMSGQLGNILSYLAFAKGIQLRLQHEYGVEVDLFAYSPTVRASSRKELKHCFPKISSMQSITKSEYTKKEEEQKLLLGPRLKALQYTNRNLKNRRNSIRPLVLTGFFPWQGQTDALNQFYDNVLSENANSTTNVSAAFLSVSNLGGNNALDHYYKEIRDFLQFETNNPKCCALTPDPDETVFVSAPIQKLVKDHDVVQK